MYAKLFARITDSSLMEQDVTTRYVFVMLLAVADATGHVIGTEIALARRFNLPLPDLRRALEKLGEPDPDSNSLALEGRRVVPSEGERGWRIVNYLAYRSLRDEQSRRDYMREYQRGRRARLRDGDVNSGKPRKPQLAQAEAEAEAEAGRGAGVPAPCPAGAGPGGGHRRVDVEAVIAHYRRHHPSAKPGTKERRLILARLEADRFTVADLCDAIDGQHRSPHHLGQNDRKTKYLGLELAMRDSAKVNQFMQLARPDAGPSPEAQVVARVAARLEGNGVEHVDDGG